MERVGVRSPAPPPSGGQASLARMVNSGCNVFEQDQWERRKKCLLSAWAGGGYPWGSIDDWCRDYNRPAGFEDEVGRDSDWELQTWGLEHCDCAHTKWLLDPPSTWPESVKSDFEAICAYTNKIGVRLLEVPPEGSGPVVDHSRGKVRCAVFNWEGFDLANMMDPETGECLEWTAPVGPCETVYWSDPQSALKCGGVSPSLLAPTSAISDFAELVDGVQCGCYGLDDFGTSCVCGASSVSCTWEGGKGGYCQCTGTCDKSTSECSGPATFSTVKSACS